MKKVKEQTVIIVCHLIIKPLNLFPKIPFLTKEFVH